LEDSFICIIDASGNVVREGKVSSEPTALIAWLSEVGVTLTRIGLEAGPLSQWLYAAMRQAGLAAELLETRHVRNAFKIMPIKTDRKDARGIAELMRLGWFRPVHCKSMEAQETRAMLTARKLVQKELLETESSLRGILRGFGLKVGKTTPVGFEGRIRELVAGHPSLEVITSALLSVRAVLRRQLNDFEKRSTQGLCPIVSICPRMSLRASSGSRSGDATIGATSTITSTPARVAARSRRSATPTSRRCG